MVRTDLLSGIIAEKGLTKRKVAFALNMNDKTFYHKMKTGVFDSDEMFDLCKLLDITDPIPIFFAERVT